MFTNSNVFDHTEFEYQNYRKHFQDSLFFLIKKYLYLHVIYRFSKKGKHSKVDVFKDYL